MKKNSIIKTIASVLAVFIFVWVAGLLLGNSIKSSLGTSKAKINPPNQDYIAVIFVNGAIQNASSDPLSTYPQTYNYNATISYIYSLVEDKNNTGIFLELNTPGGSVYDSDALYLALMYYKEQTGRPIEAYIHYYSYSGGYYISMAADKISANRNSMTGSIGVVMTHVSYAGMYEQEGIAVTYITSGKNKSMGSDALTLTEEQLGIYQSIVDESYEQFVEIVCDGRGLSREEVLAAADGRIYTAYQAQALDLIDEIGDHDDILIAFCTDNNSIYYAPDLTEYTFLQQILYSIQQVTPKTEAETLQEIVESFQPGVPLYIYSGS